MQKNLDLIFAMQASISGIRASQASITTTSLNIANAGNENYARRTVKLETESFEGVTYGVRIADVQRIIEESLLGEIRNQSSELAYTKTFDEYNARIQILIGKPTESSNLNDVLQEFFSALNDLSVKPELPSLRLIAIQKAENLADKISYLARSLNDLRYQADKDIKESTDQINFIVDKLQDINTSTLKIIGNGGDPLSSYDMRDELLKELAGYLTVKTYVKSTGAIGINTTSGLPLLDGATKYVINYPSASSVDVFYNNAEINEMALIPTDDSGMKGEKILLMTGGKSSEIYNKISSGKITALQQLRDIDIPNSITQLDILAQTLRDEINSIHNKGAGIPAADTYNGTSKFYYQDTREYTGKVRIAVLDNDGQPVIGPENKYYRPLTLDLSKLDSGLGNGTVDIKTILNEVNQYFYYDPIIGRTEIGNLNNIRIGAMSNNIAPNGTFSFDFEIDNNDNYGSNFEVTNIEVYDNTSSLVAGALTSALPGSYDLTAGNRERTRQKIDLDFSSGSGGPYTVRTYVKVTNQFTNEISSAALNFVIDDAPIDPNILNKRYEVSAVYAGDARIIAPSTTKRMLRADLIGDNGLVASESYIGNVRLKSEDINYKIVIDDLDSKERGYLDANSNKYEATNRGLSHFLGLNNLFVDDNTNTNIAMNMKLREDILADPNRLSVGKLDISGSYSDIELIGKDPAFTKIKFAGAQPNPGDNIIINGTTITFVTASVTNDQVTIGATWPLTLTNLLAKLNSVNSTTTGTIDKAIYTISGGDTLNIEYKVPGNIGNNFTFSGNFTSSAIASVNNGIPTSTFINRLSGGTEEKQAVIRKPYTYHVALGSSANVVDMASVASKTIKFKAAGSLPAGSNTIVGYTASVIAFRSSKASQAKNIYEQQKSLYDSYITKFKEGSGVNTDEELANSALYANAYQASAKALATVSELFKILIQAI